MSTEGKYCSIAWDCVNFVNPSEQDRMDCFQQAILVILQAVKSAESNGDFPSARYLYLCGRQAVFRYVLKQRAETGHEEIEAIDKSSQASDAFDARDYLRTHWSTLLPAEQRAINLVFFKGLSQTEAAKLEGVLLPTLHARIKAGIGRITTDET